MPENANDNRFSRRDFLRWFTRVAGSLIVMPILQACQKLGLISGTEIPVDPPLSTIEISNTPTPIGTTSTQSSPTATDGMARIAFVRTRDRLEGIRRALTLFGENSVNGKSVLLKPNFNSDDPAPASTHPDTLRAIVGSLQEMGANTITVADRSGMGDTRQVMDRLGVYNLAKELGFDTLTFDELTVAKDWVLIRNDGDHWENGFPVPRRLLVADAIIQTCCLKPHRFGGHFTLSLKNSVGMVGKFMGGTTNRRYG